MERVKEGRHKRHSINQSCPRGHKDCACTQGSLAAEEWHQKPHTVEKQISVEWSRQVAEQTDKHTLQTSISGFVIICLYSPVLKQLQASISKNLSNSSGTHSKIWKMELYKCQYFCWHAWPHGFGSWKSHDGRRDSFKSSSELHTHMGVHTHK